jgi:hypothetical protein
VQLGLTAVSWAVVFLTSHVGMAKVRGASQHACPWSVNPPPAAPAAAALLIGPPPVHPIPPPAKGAGLNPVTVILMIGVALAGYSTYLSFEYLSKSKKEGFGALDGWDMLNKFYEHAT